MITWNLGGHPPPEHFQIQEFILPKQEQTEESKEESQAESVDLFVVGLQEMVDLSVLGSISGKNDKVRT